MKSRSKEILDRGVTYDGQGRLAIEGNTLSLGQVTAVIAGKRVLGSTREVREVRGAVAAYELMDPAARDDPRASHDELMAATREDVMKLRSGRPGRFRRARFPTTPTASTPYLLAHPDV